MTESLLARAGLKSSAPDDRPQTAGRKKSGAVKRYDVMDDSAGQIDLPDKPV